MGGGRTEFALLLEDVNGKKVVINFHQRQSLESKIVRKGSFLEAISLEKARELNRKYGRHFNYQVYRDTEIKLECNVAQVKQLTVNQMKLLQGVEDFQERIKASDKLVWAERLRCRDEVHLTIPDKPTSVPGIIQQIGEIEGKPGIHFEVEWSVFSSSAEGYKRTDYHKVVVSMDKISDSPIVMQSSASSQTPSVQPIKKSDRVYVLNNRGKIIEGTVRWIGHTSGVASSTGSVVGIELDQRTSTSFIPSHVPGFDKYFMTEKYNAMKVVVPKSSVTRILSDVKQEGSTGPTHPYNTRSSAKQHEQQHYEQQQREKQKLEQQQREQQLHELQYYEQQQREKKKLEQQRHDKQKFEQQQREQQLHELQYYEQQQCEKQKLEQQQHEKQKHEQQQLRQQQHGSNHQSQQPDVAPQAPHDATARYNLRAHGDKSAVNAKSHKGPGMAQRVHQYDQIPGLPDEQQQPISKPEHPPPNHSPAAKNDNPFNLEVGDMVQVSHPPKYGVIKWIGYLEDISLTERVAGVETEEVFPGSTDGVWKGKQFFVSEKGKSLFCPLDKVKRDKRFEGPNEEQRKNPLEQPRPDSNTVDEWFVPCKLVEEKHIGRRKGIQGQQNSCYLDATLYGMFAFSDVFDGLFLEQSTGVTVTSKTNDTKISKEMEMKRKIQHIIQRNIVYPLRRDGLVSYEQIMHLREALDGMQTMKGVTMEEKDPEEFLNLLLKKVLQVDSYFMLRRPSGIDGEFFIQLFIEPPENRNANPSTQSLLHKMFLEQDISFTQYPSKLFLQTPRYGKNYKAFDRVIPSLCLDISVLCETSQHCFICNQPATDVCIDCGIGNPFTDNITHVCFCGMCSQLWHKNPTRNNHKPYPKKFNTDFSTGRLELLSVICIETSHYVCYTRITGSGKDQWVFFDSMAERTDDEFNLPEVTDCTDLLNSYVYGDKDITAGYKEHELVRRYLRDAYLCIYVDKVGAMYQ